MDTKVYPEDKLQERHERKEASNLSIIPRDGVCPAVRGERLMYEKSEDAQRTS